MGGVGGVVKEEEEEQDLEEGMIGFVFFVLLS